MAKPKQSQQQKKQTSSADLVRNHLPIIQTMKKAKNAKLRSQILDLSPNTVKAMGSIADNVLRGNIPLARRHTLLINKNQKQLTRLAKCSVAEKKRILQQKGDGIFTTIASLLPAVIGALASATANPRQ